jgi:hypothetical protein
MCFFQVLVAMFSSLIFSNYFSIQFLCFILKLEVHFIIVKLNETHYQKRQIICTVLGANCRRKQKRVCFKRAGWLCLSGSGPRFVNGWDCKRRYRGICWLPLKHSLFLFKCKKRLKGLNMIWQAITWRLWMARNARIFHNNEATVCEIVEAIKYTSLQWFIASRYAGVCIAYEWQAYPFDCLIR